jgi:hypothetical protein
MGTLTKARKKSHEAKTPIKPYATALAQARGELNESSTASEEVVWRGVRMVHKYVTALHKSYKKTTNDILRDLAVGHRWNFFYIREAYYVIGFLMENNLEMVYEMPTTSYTAAKTIYSRARVPNDMKAHLMATAYDLDKVALANGKPRTSVQEILKVGDKLSGKAAPRYTPRAKFLKRARALAKRFKRIRDKDIQAVIEAINDLKD